MSSQTKLIKDILLTYNTILENKKISEAEDVYDSVDFKPLNGSNPLKDNINISLLQDVQTAAKNAGVKVDITTAVTGHRRSRTHDAGNAVDIAIINGKAVSRSNDEDANKFVAELQKLGYVKNRENTSIPKAVLTFGVAGHDNHVHVSNTTNSEGEADGESEGETDDESKPNEPDALDSLIKGVTDVVFPMIGIKEEKKVKDTWFKKKRLNENIDRIKGLL